MFDYFRKAKAVEIKALEALARRGLMPPPWPGPRPGFSAALKDRAAREGLAIIAEYKRASPSRGDIELRLSPARAARGYARAGAAAISVLTEKSRFKGKLGFLRQMRAGGGEALNLPLLRKDFIFHPAQVRATAAGPASALLLIVKLIPSAAQLAELMALAEALGLEAVVEILDKDDLKAARAAKAGLIQVNARDFSDLSLNLERALALGRAEARPERELWIAASGLSRPEDLRRVRRAGFQAALVGTGLMSGGDPEGALTRLKAGAGL